MPDMTEAGRPGYKWVVVFYFEVFVEDRIHSEQREVRTNFAHQAAQREADASISIGQTFVPLRGDASLLPVGSFDPFRDRCDDLRCLNCGGPRRDHSCSPCHSTKAPYE